LTQNCDSSILHAVALFLLLTVGRGPETATINVWSNLQCPGRKGLMKNATLLAVLLMVLVSAIPAVGQHHQSNWIHRTATDSTIVPCWTDSLTWAAFPPNSMNMMMMPDSMYMRIDLMGMDSIHIPHDSTFIGWCRVQAGRDSMRFDMMNGDSMYGSHNMMQFMKNVRCQFHWDSLMSDSTHRHWHPTGMKGWNGSVWVSLGGTMTGNTMFLASSQIYSAFAFIGTSLSTVSVTDAQVFPGEFRLEQNYPNPFNPSTTIRFNLPQAEFVSLKVFNSLGEEIATIVNGPRQAGNFSVTWGAGLVPSGVYFYRLSAGSFVQTKKLVLLR
jgi:hypothetical protein